MVASLRALLEGIIDYAGLFPPARLPLEQAIRHYARYRSEPEKWMLGRFVCPAGSLAQLLPYVPELFSAGPPLALSVLGSGGNTVDAYRTAVQTEREAVQRFLDACGGRVSVEVYETRLPAAVLVPGAETLAADLCQQTRMAFAHGREVTTFVEIGLGWSWREPVTALLGKLGQRSEYGCGLKVRCGGVERTAFPAAKDVAAAIVLCRDHGMPFKATAGLHHPFRRFDPQLEVMMHGFVNVFAAAVLAHCATPAEETVCQILTEDDPRNFVFEEQALRWRDLQATTTAVTEARRWFTSFGSCSFEEPRDDLRTWGLLD